VRILLLLSGVISTCLYTCIKKNSVALVRERTMPTERPPLVGEVVPTSCVVSATDPPPPVVSLGFLDRSRYYFFQVSPQLSSRGWVDPVLDPLLLQKSGSAGNRIQDLWICSQKLWPLDHRGGLCMCIYMYNVSGDFGCSKQLSDVLDYSVRMKCQHLTWCLIQQFL
jgi:hypothetical protein